MGDDLVSYRPDVLVDRDGPRQIEVCGRTTLTRGVLCLVNLARLDLMVEFQQAAFVPGIQPPQSLGKRSRRRRLGQNKHLFPADHRKAHLAQDILNFGILSAARIDSFDALLSPQNNQMTEQFAPRVSRISSIVK